MAIRNTRTEDEQEANENDARASTFMKQGIALLEDDRPEALTQALACFDRALDLRKTLPLEVPRFRYNLAACWLNRADALCRMGEAEHVSSALAAYDESIVLLAALPLDEDPKYRRRLAVAHQNRGMALLQHDSLAPDANVSPGANTEAAAEAFASAATLLDALPVGDDLALADRSFMSAAIWVNVANLHIRNASPDAVPPSRDAAARAIALVAGLEDNDAAAAEVGLKARHVLCQALARQLSLPPAQGDHALAIVHDATDAVDDALALAARWKAKGNDRFDTLAEDLFRFGALVYERFQPQFLDEFLEEHTR